MSTFGNSVKKELGKNTGRWLSNKFFGDGHASKHNVTIRRENERIERKNEREIIRQKREYEKEEKRIQKLDKKIEREKENEIKRFEINERKRLREENKAFVEEKLQNNRNEFENFNNYIETIQKLHQIPIDNFYWDMLEIFEDKIDDNFIWHYLFEVKNKAMFDFEQALLKIVLSMAKIDKADDDVNFITNEEKDYFKSIIRNENLTYENDWDTLTEISAQVIIDTQQSSTEFLQEYFKIGYNRAGRIIDQLEEIGIVGQFQGTKPREILIEDITTLEDVFENENVKALKSLSQAPLLYKIKSIGYLKEMAWVSRENDINNNMSDIEWEYLLKIAKQLNIPFDLLRISHSSNYINCSTAFIKNTFLPESIYSSKSIPKTRPKENDNYFKKHYLKIITEPIKKHLNELINEGNEKFGVNWLDKDYELIIERITKKINDKSEIFKNKTIISSLFNKKKNELLQIEIDNLKKEKNELVIIQKEKKNTTKYNELLQEISEKTNKEIKNLITFWDDTWIKEYQNFLLRKEAHFIAKEVLKKNSDVYYEAFSIAERLTFLDDFGSSIAFKSYENTIEIDFFINIDDIVPINKKTITKSSKLSSKPYTNTERNLLIQDYICSSILRIAKELFLTFPIENVIVHAIDSIINTSTGNFEDVIILSVNIDKLNFNNLNLNRIDPSDAIERFNHNMKFMKSKGFTPILKIN